MVFGRKQEASDDGTGPLKDANSATTSRGRDVQTGDRRSVG